MQIEDGTDGGGWRQFLAGRAIHAGSMLEMEVPGVAWLPARYEMDYHARQGSVHLRLFVPHSDKEIVLPIDREMRFRWPPAEAGEAGDRDDLESLLTRLAALTPAAQAAWEAQQR